MNIIDKIETDVKAEVLAVSLLTETTDFSKIIFKRLGLDARGHTKDINRVYSAQGLFDLNQYTIIEIYRQSIYEAVPEHVFHPSTLGGFDKTEEDIINEIRLQRKREDEARKFLQPFEQEASYIEMQALLIELMFDKKENYDNLLHLFQQGWPILKKLSKATALAYIYILSILHKVRGDKDWTEKALSFILGYTVEIFSVIELKKIGIQKESFEIGGCRLGIESNLSGFQYDGVADWKVQIGPIPEKSAISVLPGSDFIDLVNILSEQFIPANIFTQIKIVTEKSSDSILSESNSESCILDYTFYL
ncbi:hypothetical protein [Pedobacter nototheniae]|uniref:hypothetical protein n=1 Tax=Pedobacter nototheniae TaxID=2488994 RepID=UPI0010396F6A|nr:MULTISPECIES: hypothetical protein [Pedobacter]